MYQAILQKIASIPQPSAVPPTRIALEDGQALSIEFTVLPKEGRGFFLSSEVGMTYTSEVIEVWSPTKPTDKFKTHGIEVGPFLGPDLSLGDVVFVTENTIYALRSITESKRNGQETE
jgi:hypothetical protein